MQRLFKFLNLIFELKLILGLVLLGLFVLLSESYNNLHHLYQKERFCRNLPYNLRYESLPQTQISNPFFFAIQCCRHQIFLSMTSAR